MDSIREYFLRTFGLNLSDVEIKKILDWYEQVGKNVPEEAFFSELQGVVVTLFPDRRFRLLEEDLSDMSVILAALDKATRK